MDLDLQGVDVSIRPTPRPSLSDLHFLANFIVSAYLGPDVKSENPRRSALQRVAEGLPPYTLNDLGLSFVSVSQLESLYYFILRHALPNLALNPYLFHMYLKGDLPLLNSGLPEDRLQFTSFFPLHLHEQTSFLRGLNIVKGIVIISEPDTSYMKHDELERFRSLSGMDSLNIDINESQRYQHRHWAGREEIGRNFSTINEGPYAGHASNLNSISPFKVQDEFKRMRLHEPLEMPVVHLMPSVLHGSQRPCNLDGPSMIPLLSIPNAEECKSEASVVFTGVAREVSAGPPIGRVDIGVSKTAYFFRVALPGVRKDNCEFSTLSIFLFWLYMAKLTYDIHYSTNLGILLF